MANDDKEDGFKVSVAGPGIAVTQPVTEADAHSVVAFILKGTAGAIGAGLNKGGGSGGDPAAAAHVRSGRGKTAREAINEAQAKRSFDKITAIGAMLIDNGHESFTTDDIRAQFRRASEALPANFNRDMRSAVKIGWIARDHDNADAFFVTQSGRDAIAGKFSGEARATVGRAKQKSKRLRKPAE